MKVTKFIIEFEDGSVKWIDDDASIHKLKLAVPANLQWHAGSAIETLSKKYFVMLDELRASNVTGYGKVDLHDALKPLLLNKFRDFPHYFTNAIPEYSTKHLNRDGWIALIEQLKSVSADVFGYVFKL